MGQGGLRGLWCSPMWARSLLGAVIVGAVTIGGTFSSQVHQHAVRHLDALGVTLLAIVCAAMVLRRRDARAALLVVALAVCTYFSLGYPWGPVFLPMTIAIVTAVLGGHRASAWIACAFMYASIVWGGYYLGGAGRRPGLAAAVETAAWPLLVLIGAEVVRSGRERAASAARGRAELSMRRASEERLRIAQELHDVLAHNISLISVQAGVALHLMDERPDQAVDQARTALTAIKQASKEALGELRSVLGLLRTTSGEHAPLTPVAGLEQLSDLTSRASAAGLAVHTDITGDQRPLPPDTNLAAYRIVQEALTNAIRHSGATSVAVRVRYSAAAIGIEVEDNGHGAATGPDGGPPTGGNGIAGMRERARLVGGHLTTGSPPGGGFVVRAQLPFRRGEHHPGPAEVEGGNGAYRAPGARAAGAM